MDAEIPVNTSSPTEHDVVMEEQDTVNTTEQPVQEETSQEEISQEETSREEISQEETTINQEDMAIQEETPKEDTVMESPIVKEESPIVQEDSVSVQEEAPLVKEETHQTQEETPSAQEESPAVQEETTTTVQTEITTSVTTQEKPAVEESTIEPMEDVVATEPPPFLSAPASWQIPVAALHQQHQKPHDVVMNKTNLRKERLELRIKESKYDIEAWTSLINDAQQTGDLEVIRDIYERFLNVFPTSVSLLFFTHTHTHIQYFTFFCALSVSLSPLIPIEITIYY